MAKFYFLDHHSACLIATIFLILNKGMRTIADDEDRKASTFTSSFSFFFFFFIMLMSGSPTGL